MTNTLIWVESGKEKPIEEIPVLTANKNEEINPTIMYYFQKKWYYDEICRPRLISRVYVNSDFNTFYWAYIPKNCRGIGRLTKRGELR